MAEQEAERLLTDAVWSTTAAPIVDPVGAMQELAGRLRHAVDVLGARAEETGQDSATAAAWLKAARELRQLLEGMERLNLGEKVVQLEAAKLSLVAAAVDAALAGLPVAEIAERKDRFVLSLRQQDPGVPVPPFDRRSSGSAGVVVVGESVLSPVVVTAGGTESGSTTRETAPAAAAQHAELPAVLAADDPSSDSSNGTSAQPMPQEDTE